MGYAVHITRAKRWYKGKPITLEEWLAYVRSDPEMRLEGVFRTKTPWGETFEYKSEGLAVWTAYSGGQAMFDHLDEKIIVSNPDEEIIAKMVRIARALGARVQGEEGETY